MQNIVDSLAQTRRSHFNMIEKMTLNDIKELVSTMGFNLGIQQRKSLVPRKRGKDELMRDI